MKPLMTILFCLICIQLFACCNNTNGVTANSHNVLNNRQYEIENNNRHNCFHCHIV